MKIYIAEINGEAIIAFPAKSDEAAHAAVKGPKAYIRVDLEAGVLRADGVNGGVICVGDTEILARRATDPECEQWLRGRDKEDFKTWIARKMLAIYLIPVIMRANPIHRQWTVEGLEEAAKRARAQRIGGPLLELELRLEAIDGEIRDLKFRQPTPLLEAAQRQCNLLETKRHETKALLAILWEADHNTKH
jgi:hypothetical protein